jgi:small-conductance mechanosensitive channel
MSIAGMDIGAMLWPLLCITFYAALGKWDFGWHDRFRVTLICSLCSICVDILLLIAALTRQWILQRLLTWLHVLGYALMWTFRLQHSSWIMTHLAAILHSFWVSSRPLAAL